MHELVLAARPRLSSSPRLSCSPGARESLVGQEEPRLNVFVDDRGDELGVINPLVATA